MAGVEVAGLVLALPFAPQALNALENLELKESQNGWLSIVNIFPDGSWRGLALLKAFQAVVSAPFRTVQPLLLWPLYLARLLARPLFRVLEKMSGKAIKDLVQLLPDSVTLILSGTLSPSMRNLLGLGKPMNSSVPNVLRLKFNVDRMDGTSRSSKVFWRALLQIADTRVFERLYMQAWIWHLTGRDDVVNVHVFMDNESLCIPILLDKKDGTLALDRQTLEALRMWYCWLRVRRGIVELLLPKKLVRIDRVEIKNANSGVPILGPQIETLELGRRGPSQVAGFERLTLVPEDQRFITQSIILDTENAGLEFVTEWDGYTISLISLTPFVGSLIFAAVWIAVFIARDGVDTQVAVQTAFTVASYIVTAGALLIALFAFLDSQSGRAFGNQAGVRSWVVNNVVRDSGQLVWHQNNPRGQNQA